VMKTTMDDYDWRMAYRAVFFSISFRIIASLLLSGSGFPVFGLSGLGFFSFSYFLFFIFYLVFSSRQVFINSIINYFQLFMQLLRC